MVSIATHTSTMVFRAILTTDLCNMAVVFSRQRPIGKLAPHPSGAIAAQIGNRRLGLFTSAGLAIAAILDLAAPPLTGDAWLAWFEAIVTEEER
jgi:HAMP domain-containing protein